MKEVLIPRISPFSYIFPDPLEASKEGLVAYGGDLDPNRILSAYKRGIFPWYSKGDPILWWSPDPRLILYPEELKISRSLKKVIKRGEFEIGIDRDFASVIRACKDIERPGQEGTWILPEIVEAYEKLHEMGFAHSIEVYQKGELAGGLYGLSMGSAFFGESMFSRVSDASKIALVALCSLAKRLDFDFIDCQIPSDHLKRMGAIEIDRAEFLSRLSVALQKPSYIGCWKGFEEVIDLKGV